MDSTTSSDSFFESIYKSSIGENIIILILILVLVLIYFFSKYIEPMSGGTLTQLFAQDAQDIYLKGNVDQLATGNFMLYWNQPTRVASGYSWGNGVPNRGQLVSTLPPVKPTNTANYGMGKPNNDMTLNVNLVNQPDGSNSLANAQDYSRFQQDVNSIQQLEASTKTTKNPYANKNIPIRVPVTRPDFVSGNVIGYSGKTAPGTWDSYDINQAQLQQANKKAENFANLSDQEIHDQEIYDQMNNSSITPSKPGSARQLAQLGKFASCPCMDGNCHNCLRCRMIDCPNCRLGRCPNCQTGNCPLCKLNQRREQGIRTSLPNSIAELNDFPNKSCSTCIQPDIQDDLLGEKTNQRVYGSYLGENLIGDQLDQLAGLGKLNDNQTNKIEPFISNSLTQQFVNGCMQNNCSGCPTCLALNNKDSLKENFNNLDNLGNNKLAINVGGQLVCSDKSGNCGLKNNRTGIFSTNSTNSSNLYENLDLDLDKSDCLNCKHRAVSLSGNLFCPCVNGNCDSCEKCKLGLCSNCPKTREQFLNINEQPNLYSYPAKTQCDCMREGCPLCNISNDMSIDLPSFGTWYGGYRLANGWNEATPGLSPVNLTDSLVYYPDSYVGSYFTNPKPDIMKPYPIMPANDSVSSIRLSMN